MRDILFKIILILSRENPFRQSLGKNYRKQIRSKFENWRKRIFLQHTHIYMYNIYNTALHTWRVWEPRLVRSIDHSARSISVANRINPLLALTFPRCNSHPSQKQHNVPVQSLHNWFVMVRSGLTPRTFTHASVSVHLATLGLITRGMLVKSIVSASRVVQL